MRIEKRAIAPQIPKPERNLVKLGCQPKGKAKIQSVFDELAAYRHSLGLPPAGSETDKSTIAKLEIAGQSFFWHQLWQQPESSANNL
ncbi:MAG: hypothetical protein ACMG55_02015 [Microcoleus sp.]